MRMGGAIVAARCDSRVYRAARSRRASGNTRRDAAGTRRGARFAALRYDASRPLPPRQHRPCAMNAPLPLTDRIADADNDAAAAAPRLREIPYNYTSFSDREIVIRLLGARAWEVLDRLRERAPHRPLGAHALRGAGRHLGGAAQPLPAGRPARQPKRRRRLLIEALQHRLAEVEKRRTPGRRRRRATRSSASCCSCRATRGRGLRRAASARSLGPAQAHGARVLAPRTPPRTTSSSTACRASRT